MNWIIESIAADPGVVDTLAVWHHRQWGELMAPWSLVDARTELTECVVANGFPATLVAYDESRQLAGSVSLVATDAPEFPEFSPWLASLYVAPLFRGRGLGTQLVDALVAHAQQLGFERLYLFTPGSPQIYRRSGWREIGKRQIGDHDVTLMVHE